MGSGSGTALGIIGIIIAAGAIGFAFFVWNGTNSDLDDLTDQLNNLESDFNNLTQTIVVGIWDALDDNEDYAPYNSQHDWLFEFGDNNLSNTDYISVSNGDTRITLLQSGWYRIQLSVYLDSINANDIYEISLLKDGAIEWDLFRLDTSFTIESSYHYVDSSAFVYSDGTNYIEINALSLGGDYFNPDTTYDGYHHFTIEYVAI